MTLNRPLEPALTKDTTALAQFSYKMMDTALRALYTRDYELAESTLVEREKMTALETKLVERLLKEKMPANELSAVTLIAESLRRFGEYATDVAEVVLNLTVDKSINQIANEQ